MTVQVQSEPTVVFSQEWFILICFWGMPTKICAACILSHGCRSQLELVTLSEVDRTCLYACKCIIIVQSQHSTVHISSAPPQSLNKMSCRDTLDFSQEWAEQVQLLLHIWTLSRLALTSQGFSGSSAKLHNFLIQSAFPCTGLSHFHVYNMSGSYLSIIFLEKLLSLIIYHEPPLLLYKMSSALHELKFQCRNIFLNSESSGRLCIYGGVYTHLILDILPLPQTEVFGDFGQQSTSQISAGLLAAVKVSGVIRPMSHSGYGRTLWEEDTSQVSQGKNHSTDSALPCSDQRCSVPV